MSQELISTLLPVVLIGLIGLLVGAVVGYLLASLSNQTAPSEPARSKSLAELARLWRDRRSGKISLEMDGKMLASPADLNAAQRAALTQAVDELQLWLSAGELASRAESLQTGAAPGVAPGVAAGVAAGSAAAAPLPEPSPLAPAVPPPVQPAPAAAKAIEPALPDALLPAEPEVKPPSMELRDILSRAFTSDKSKTAAKPVKSITAQVDEIVQERLPGSPFKDHLITLTELPSGGLLVKVDDTRYEGIGDVADPEIRAFLRECVAEWERRTERAK